MPNTPVPLEGSHNGKSPGAFNRFEGAALLLSVLVAHLFLARNAALPLAYDDYDYAMAGRSILENGLFTKFYGSDIRTYGYPLFMSLAQAASDATGLTLRFIVFEVQLTLYLLGAAFLRIELCKRSEVLGRVAFCAIALNFYALLYTAEVLTESLSVTALLVTAASWLRLQREPQRLAPLLAGSVVAAAAVMIRPANLFLLGSWIAGGLVILGPFFGKRRAFVAAVGRLGAVVLVASAIFLPQLVNNIRNWQLATPLTATDLMLMQQHLGVQNLKYATALPPAAAPEVFYKNPLAEGTAINPARPLRWYLDYPFRGALTMALHIVNMTDQDLLFTYAPDLRPPYRIPHTLLNHAIVALGLLGFFMWWREVVRRRERAEAEAAATVTVLVVSNCAIYATAAVEMRFGLTLLTVLFPCAAYALLRLRAMESSRARLAAAAFIAAYAGGALLLSDWVRSQSAQITPV